MAARRRLEALDGRYKLLDAAPLSPGEPESVPRARRRRKARRQATPRAEGGSPGRRPTYADLGRAVLERVIEMGRETSEAVSTIDSLRREAKENKATRIEAEQRAAKLFERVKELETKLEMAEANLRTVLAAARGRGATTGPTDNEMEALLRILKTPSQADQATDSGVEVLGAAGE